jgi:hypothetical protein
MRSPDLYEWRQHVPSTCRKQYNITSQTDEWNPQTVPFSQLYLTQLTVHKQACQYKWSQCSSITTLNFVFILETVPTELWTSSEILTANSVCSRHKLIAGILQLQKAKNTVKMTEHTASLVNSWMLETIDCIHLISKGLFKYWQLRPMLEQIL